MFPSFCGFAAIVDRGAQKAQRDLYQYSHFLTAKTAFPAQ
jgi:hypothetical protein